jgi:hypothetical protein
MVEGAELWSAVAVDGAGVAGAAAAGAGAADSGAGMLLSAGAGVLMSGEGVFGVDDCVHAGADMPRRAALPIRMILFIELSFVVRNVSGDACFASPTNRV